jgi:hypothetical protein
MLVAVPAGNEAGENGLLLLPEAFVFGPEKSLELLMLDSSRKPRQARLVELCSLAALRIRRPPMYHGYLMYRGYLRKRQARLEHGESVPTQRP